ncbi:hypothetical protein AB4Z38_07040 [Arthrobacter sp. 2RAF6]|uniref:hypothetical protein n=1 Tax=Arthrobacter sp. 2RAF6 TaxID=3233002 RepID=UPI003F8F0A69
MTELAGQVGLRQHATDWIGESIEWATDSITHHVVIHIGYGFCVSAERPRVRIRTVAEYPALVNSDFDLTDEQRERIVKAALSMINLPYNTAVLVILGLHKVTGWPIPLWVRGWLNRRPNVDCSDLCNRALNAGGIRLFTQDTTLVTPADFQHALEQQAQVSNAGHA